MSVEVFHIPHDLKVVAIGRGTFFNPLTPSRPTAFFIFLPAAAGVISSDFFARSAEACFRKH
jgi:hypothetical protein